MEEKRRCNNCNVQISKTNWSKHVKTKKHLAGISDSTQREGLQIKRCGICNVDVLENAWIKHLKSHSHKRNTKLIKNKLKEKVRSFNIRRQRKRNFEDIDFETNDYIVKNQKKR